MLVWVFVLDRTQEAAKAKAEAKTAGLARENLEVALKELARLLEFAREAAGSTRGRGDSSPGRTGGVGDEPLNTAALSSRWDRSKEEAKRFARVMVRKTAVVVLPGIVAYVLAAVVRWRINSLLSFGCDSLSNGRRARLAGWTHPCSPQR